MTYATARVGSRHYFASTHLWNARHLARLCQQRESELVAQNAYEPDMEQRSLCVSTLQASVAFLEALVNEVWQDAADTPADEDNQRLAGLSRPEVARLRELWRAEGVERNLRLLDKYSVALVAADKPPLDKGREPYGSVKVAVRLRNALVHFIPELQWHDEEHEFEQALRGKFTENPLPLGDPWYPNKALGAGCAQWAWENCRDFASEWWQQMGLQRDFLVDFASWPEP
ncbi:MAG: hypothetical protein WB785_22450 [Mycobacterium sp.]|uniref:hypothetical protein n=1 Tax=Mycobacterium sp. TaxID=1785 RepID=UPI003C6385A8